MTRAVVTATDRRFFVGLALISLMALALRLIFYSGIVGSDDNVYFLRALDVATGTWSTANYNGALRYGFNIPAGAAMALLGHSTAAAAVWPTMCSIAEVGLVGLVAWDFAGRRGGWLAAALLATAPLHIAVATRIHTDPVVSCFLTAGFCTLWFALRRHDDRLMMLAGACFGLVFWAKELAAVTYFGALPMLWYFRGRWQSLGWLLAGFAAVLTANFALMHAISGDALHAVKVVLGAVGRNFVGASQGEDAALYYVPYLLLDPRHVGLLGWLAVLGLASTLPRLAAGATVGTSPTTPDATGNADAPGAGFFVLWLVGLLVVLSFFPVSLHPLRLTMKQSNYITLFLGPLALVAMLGLRRLSRRIEPVVVALTLAFGVLLGALQQADLRAFTANSKALWSYLQSRPGALAVASQGNVRVVTMLGDASPAVSPAVVISPDEVRTVDPRTLRARPGVDRMVAIVDPQTMRWMSGGFERPLPCWKQQSRLTPQDLGAGNRVAGALLSVARRLPAGLGRAAQSKLGPLVDPEPATVYDVPGFDLWCRAVSNG